MRTHNARAPFLLLSLLSLSLAGCFGGHGGGGGGGNGGGGGTPTPKLRVDFTGGPFTAFQQGASYQLMVRNKGDAATTGMVTLADPPTGMTVTSIAGPNWACTLATTTCSRSDPLGPGATYDPITVTGNVTVGAGGSVSATVTVTGGGAATFTGSGSIPVNGGGNVSILFGQYAFLFSGFGPNGVAVAVAGSINVDANGNVTGEEDFKDPLVVHSAQPINGACQNYPVAATGFCRLTAGNATYQYDFALRSNQLVARFFENTIDGTGITGSGILISQQVPSSGALTSPGGFNGYFSIGFSGTDTAGGRIALEGSIFTDLSATITSPMGFPSQADVNDNGTLIQPASSTTPNVTGNMTGQVDADGRVTATLTIGGSQTLTLALYILAPEAPTTNQSGRAFAIDITPIATSRQVLSGQFFWLGPPPLNLTIDSINFPVNVFALWGVTPGPPVSSSTQLGTFNGATGSLIFDSNDSGKFNGGSPPQSGPQSGTITIPISVAPNGRATLAVTVNGTASTYVLYLDAVSDGNMLGATVGGANDPKVSFGFFTGQVPTSSFNNTKITGNYVVGTTTPVLATVPDGAAPITLTPTVANSGTFSVSAGAVTGNYSFDPTTGRGIATASSGNIFKNSSAVFYIIAPRVLILMGADPNVTNDAIALMQP